MEANDLKVGELLELPTIPIPEGGMIFHYSEGFNLSSDPNDWRWIFIVRCRECGKAIQYSPCDVIPSLCEHNNEDDFNNYDDHWVVLPK